MSKFAFPAVLAVALGFATVDDARAQYIVNGGYTQGYYGGYLPGYYNGGLIRTGGSGYYYNNNYSYQSVPNYGYGYGNYPSYSGYSNNYSPALRSYYNFYRRGAAGNNYNYNRRWR